METQVYQAILERRPAQIIPRLKEILAKPDPALGYYNGELRFWLGWAQEVAGDHAAAQESWRQARSELEPFLKEQPENYLLIGDLALTNMGLGDKAAALALSERAMAAAPDRERRGGWSRSDRDPRPGGGADWESPTAPSPLYRNCSRYRTRAHWLRACRSLLRCSGSIRCSIRSGMIRASRNFAKRSSHEIEPWAGSRFLLNLRGPSIGVNGVIAVATTRQARLRSLRVQRRMGGWLSGRAARLHRVIEAFSPVFSYDGPPTRRSQSQNGLLKSSKPPDLTTPQNMGVESDQVLTIDAAVKPSRSFVSIIAAADGTSASSGQAPRQRFVATGGEYGYLAGTCKAAPFSPN